MQLQSQAERFFQQGTSELQFNCVLSSHKLRFNTVAEYAAAKSLFATAIISKVRGPSAESWSAYIPFVERINRFVASRKW